MGEIIQFPLVKTREGQDIILPFHDAFNILPIQIPSITIIHLLSQDAVGYDKPRGEVYRNATTIMSNDGDYNFTLNHQGRKRTSSHLGPDMIPPNNRVVSSFTTPFTSNVSENNNNSNGQTYNNTNNKRQCIPTGQADSMFLI